MKDRELLEALAAQLRAYSTTPLADCEAHPHPQVGYEDPDGCVYCAITSGRQSHIALGDTSESLVDELAINITGVLAHDDTQANERNIEDLREQITDVLRDNRTLTAGDENAITNAEEEIAWAYGIGAAGEKPLRTCTVRVVYMKHPDA